MGRVLTAQLREDAVGAPVDVAIGISRVVLSRNRRRQALARQRDISLRFPTADLPAAVLLDSLNAGRFAAAAYGPAQLEGFFSTPVTVAALRLPIFKRVIVTDRGHFSEAARIMLEPPTVASQFPSSLEVLEAIGRDEVNRASLLLAVDHHARRVILAFRGTTSNSDMITDLLPEPLAFSGKEALVVSSSGAALKFALGCAPEGFLRSARDAHEYIGSRLAAAERKYPHYETILTGHSLGAIIANVFFFEYASTDNYKRRRVIGFSPAPCVEQVLADHYRAHTGSLYPMPFQIVNYTYGHDIVPRLQISALRRMFEEHKIRALECLLGALREQRQAAPRSSYRYCIPGQLIWMDATDADTPLRLVCDSGHTGDTDITPAMIDHWWYPIPGPQSIEHHFLAHICRRLHYELFRATFGDVEGGSASFSTDV
jgi:hypothetical protein